jgi:anti-sigma-K factor RskA
MTTENAKSGDSRLDQVIAGEYVLGVLSPEDRQKVEARMTLDRNFAAMVDHWRSNMLSVDHTPRPSRRAPRRTTPFAEPVAGRPETIRSDTKIWDTALWQSVAFWRGVACIALIGLAGVGLSLSGAFGGPVARPLVTRLGVSGSDLALAARYDAADGRLRLAPVAAAADAPGPADAKALEVWLTPPGGAAISLGVFRGDGDIVVPKAARSRMTQGATLAVTLEPAGGSPTGAPTGRIIAEGISSR